MDQSALTPMQMGQALVSRILLQEERVHSFVFTKQNIWFPYNKNVLSLP